MFVTPVNSSAFSSSILLTLEFVISVSILAPVKHTRLALCDLPSHERYTGFYLKHTEPSQISNLKLWLAKHVLNTFIINTILHIFPSFLFSFSPSLPHYISLSPDFPYHHLLLPIFLHIIHPLRSSLHFYLPLFSLRSLSLALANNQHISPCRVCSTIVLSVRCLKYL